mmetsp:Transcript_8228/g.11873  ORF Transcript_8228/g.11873 Transcript_8228/m.11873 type:complete len:122 (-) Transcript_8228:107-472(-)
MVRTEMTPEAAFLAAINDGGASEISFATNETAMTQVQEEKEEELEGEELEEGGEEEDLEEGKGERRMIERTKNFAIASWQSIRAFEQKHQLVDKTMKGIHSGAVFVTQKVQECNTRDTTME